MIKRLSVVGLSVCALAGIFSAPAGAAGQVCYEVQVTAQGSSVVSEAACHQLP